MSRSSFVGALAKDRKDRRRRIEERRTISHAAAKNARLVASQERKSEREQISPQIAVEITPPSGSSVGANQFRMASALKSLTSAVVPQASKDTRPTATEM